MPVPLYELMFNLTNQICEKYKSINPFSIRREKSGEVFLLIKRINKSNKRIITKNEQEIRKSNGDVIIRRAAKNDNWY